MSDSSLSSDLEQEFSPPPAQEKQHKSRSKRTVAKSPNAPPKPTKDELRLHKALKKQHEKAKCTGHCAQAVLSAALPVLESTLAYSKGVSQSLPDVSTMARGPQPSPRRHLPEVTFTPTAAGLRTGEPFAQFDLQSVLSDGLANVLAASMHQAPSSALPHTVSTQAQVHVSPPDGYGLGSCGLHFL